MVLVLTRALLSEGAALPSEGARTVPSSAREEAEPGWRRRVYGCWAVIGRGALFSAPVFAAVRLLSFFLFISGAAATLRRKRFIKHGFPISFARDRVQGVGPGRCGERAGAEGMRGGAV
ncbi:unnamed protein product [Prorocentrum cordatum]|uniref:Uncharacterized protein n=1 Tax=Prorocentrum cordatum TaxID=2364126 RepID=A0ABN9X9S5_9DINO|nr:unnamed protein product [Polarella glacialis]